MNGLTQRADVPTDALYEPLILEYVQERESDGFESRNQQLTPFAFAAAAIDMKPGASGEVRVGTVRSGSTESPVVVHYQIASENEFKLTTGEPGARHNSYWTSSLHRTSSGEVVFRHDTSYAGPSVEREFKLTQFTDRRNWSFQVKTLARHPNETLMNSYDAFYEHKDEKLQGRSASTTF